MDEAVVRIVLQDDGGTTPGAGGAPPPSDGGGGGNAGVGGGGDGGATSSAAGNYTPLTGRFAPRLNNANFDPVEEAKRRREREEKLQQIDDAYHELYPEPEHQFDPVVEAQRLLDTRRRREEVLKELDRLDPTATEERQQKLLELEAQAALNVARKQQEITDQKQAALDKWMDRQDKLLELEARAALNVARKQEEQRQADIPVLETTPFQKAKERYEAKQKKDEVDAEYKKHFKIEEVEPEKGTLDQLLGLAKMFRGTIGMPS